MLRMIQDFRSVEKAASLYATICVIALMVFTSLTAQNLFTRLSPQWELGYLPWLGGLAALEAILSQRLLRRVSDLETNPTIYRVIEVLVILTVVRLTSLPWQSGIGLIETLKGWQTDFVGNFLDGRFLVSGLVMIIIWGMSGLYAEDLVELEGDELALDAGSLEGLVSDRAAAQRRLTGRVFAVGGVLVFINGLLRQEIIHIFGEVAAPKLDVWHVVAYFVVGLVLLSLSQMANRRLAWAWEQIPVNTEIASRWITTSLIFLIAVAGIAFILPTGYTLGFLPTFSYVVGTIFYFLFGLIILILTPIFYAFAWLMSLFRFNVSTRPFEMVQRPELIPPEVLAQTDQPAWWALLRSILFWVVLLGVVGYAVFIYFRQNKETVKSLRRVRGFRWLAKAWEWLVSRIKAGTGRAPDAIMTGLNRLRETLKRRKSTAPVRYLSLRRLSPREKIIFYYQALLRRADEAALPRSGWQTPLEYETYLRNQVPEAAQEVASMTETFVEARYSQHVVSEDKIQKVRQAWEFVRMTLRGRSRKRQDDG